jgi:hypothetical protein
MEAADCVVTAGGGGGGISYHSTVRLLGGAKPRPVHDENGCPLSGEGKGRGSGSSRFSLDPNSLISSLPPAEDKIISNIAMNTEESNCNNNSSKLKTNPQRKCNDYLT